MKFSTTQWISWIAATVSAAVVLTAFAYQNFETKEDSKEKKQDIMEAIRSMDQKVDKLDRKVDKILLK